VSTSGVTSRQQRHQDPTRQAQARPTQARQDLVNAAAMAARLHQNAYDQFEDTVAEYFGVNRRDMRCLEALDRAGRLTATEIARETGLTSGAVTAMLDRLERAGYVRRLRDEADRRRVLVEMTDRARQRAREVYGPVADTVAEFDRYTDRDLAVIRDFLEWGSDQLIAHAARVDTQRRRRTHPTADTPAESDTADAPAAGLLG
jgi:DNA-binding MarR family transcriptional regulator